MRRPRRTGAWLLLAILLAQTPAAAIETDPYQSWGHALEDSTAALNAKVELELERVLASLNRRRTLRRLSCESVTERIAGHFRGLIFHPVELWASKSALVDRWPPTEELELSMRKDNLLGNRGPLDIGGWLIESPTIRLADVRIGTDKLAHFFSGGGSYYRFYRRFVAQGFEPAEAEREVIDRGIFSEKTYLGYATSGVLSVSDLEANYRGMRFLLDLCDGEDPQLRLEGGAWTLARPFDFREYVTVEWDEAYASSVFDERRFRKVLPRLLGYCPLREHPLVVEMLRGYAARDRVTPTETRLAEHVAADRLDDLRKHSLDTVCEQHGE